MNPYNFLDDNGNTLTGKMGKELTYLRTIAKQADKYGEIIKTAYNKASTMVTYPAVSNSLANQLKIVARLIKGGLKTRVYMVTLGSFDTHSSQVAGNDHKLGTHANLMAQLSDAITAFQRDIEAMQLPNRVLGMTFSEFGRRINSNASSGTDHGAAYPAFVFGTRLFGGVLGASPSIAASTANANMVMQYDFRSIYASILKDWFCVDSTSLNAIMQIGRAHV